MVVQERLVISLRPGALGIKMATLVSTDGGGKVKREMKY